jgi:ubiquinone/menaquinone biosynthesis C-methylase UbiE
VSETDRIARAYRDRDTTAAGRYDLKNPGNRQVLSERRRVARGLLERADMVPLGERRVLEVGCGNGAELAWLVELGASPSRLVGVDLLPDRIEVARRDHPDIEFRTGNAEHLDFEDASFDLVQVFTVFTSIFDRTMAANVAREIVRVLRPGGGVLWYDFRYDNPSNQDVRGVGERRVRELFPTLEGTLHPVTLLPPLARRLGPLTGAAYPVLAAVRPLRSHLVGLLRKPH